MANGQDSGVNGGSKGAAAFLNQLNLPTLLVILLSGGGNFLATQRFSGEREAQVQDAVHKISDLHRDFDDFQRSQRDVVEKVTSSLANQTTMLRNQGKLLENQQEVLETMHRREQNRGNPSYHGD